MSKSPIRPVLGIGRSAIEVPIRANVSQKRCFSASVPNQLGNVILFKKSSNKELDDILDVLKHKVILPSALPRAEQKRIFRSRWKQKLNAEPIEIEINDEKYRIRHIAVSNGEGVNAKRMVFQAMDKMQDAHDWQKLPKLLQAIWYEAGRRFDYSDWLRIIRKIGLSGNLKPLFTAIQDPKKTGLKLDKSEKVQEVMTSIVWKAATLGFSQNATLNAYRHTAKVLATLDLEEHKLGKQATALAAEAGYFELRRDPQILATPMFLAAAMVVWHGKPAYVDTVRRYAQVVVEQWPEKKGLLQLHPDAAYIEPEAMQYLMEKNRFLLVAAPIQKGLALAAEALGKDELAKQLRLRRDRVNEEVQAAAAAAEVKKGMRGMLMLDMCSAGPKAEVAEAAEEGEAKSNKQKKA